MSLRSSSRLYVLPVPTISTARHDESRRAEAALDRRLLDERLLDGAQLAVRAVQALYREDPCLPSAHTVR